jgi:hypothetical protein
MGWLSSRRGSGRSDQPEVSEVDLAILGYLGNRNEHSAKTLAETGSAGMSRMFDLVTDPLARPLPSPPSASLSKDASEAGIHALRVVALANPSAFVDRVEEASTSKLFPMVLSILGDITDPRATQMLCGYVEHSDWFTRCSAVTALRRRNEFEARWGIQQALDDPNLVVRTEAIVGVSQWDPAKGIHLFREFLTDPGITPLLRTKAENAVRDLQSGHPVRDPFGQ